VSKEIQTDCLIIEPFSEDLLTETYVSWLNDPIVVEHSRQRHYKHTLQQCKEYFLSFNNSEDLFLSIKLKNITNDHIGNMTITIDRLNAVADVAIAIGDRRCWGKGYGSEAWKSVCDFLIFDKEFRKVTGGCYQTNEAMKKIMIKSGMQFDGIRKGQAIKDNLPVDLIYYALFNDSWNQQNFFDSLLTH